MANIDTDWDVEGIIQPEESVRGMLEVISTKGPKESGTFWCWDGRVSGLETARMLFCSSQANMSLPSPIHGDDLDSEDALGCIQVLGDMWRLSGFGSLIDGRGV